MWAFNIARSRINALGTARSSFFGFLISFLRGLDVFCSEKSFNAPVLLFVFCALVASTVGAQAAESLNAVAERYAHLVLALGQHDPDYVDAFYGPAEWKSQAEKGKKSLNAIGTEAAELIATLAKTSDTATEFLKSSFYRSSNSSNHPGA